jgi:hypothetical protein
MILFTAVLIVISAAVCVLYVRFFADGASSPARRLLGFPVVIRQLPQIIVALPVLPVLRLRGARLTVSSYNRKRPVRYSGVSSLRSISQRVYYPAAQLRQHFGRPRVLALYSAAYIRAIVSAGRRDTFRGF